MLQTSINHPSDQVLPVNSTAEMTRKSVTVRRCQMSHDGAVTASGLLTYLFDVAHPVPDVIEGLLIGDVIDQHNPLQTGSDISPALPG